MKVAVIVNLINQVVSEDKVASKVALKELKREIRYKLMSERITKLIFETLEPYPTYQLPHQRVSLLWLYGRASLGKGADAYYEQLLELVLNELQHERGDVREAARRLLHSVRSIRLFQSSSPGGNKDLLSIIDSVEKLILKYKPANPPLTIEVAKPSMFKTLALAWHDLASIPVIDEELDYLGRMIELDIPPFDYQMPDDNPAEVDFAEGIEANGTEDVSLPEGW